MNNLANLYFWPCENTFMRIQRIQDDGERFIIHGENGLYNRLNEVFENIALGVSVTPSDNGEAHILYTENNRDIVLRILHDHTRS